LFTVCYNLFFLHQHRFHHGNYFSFRSILNHVVLSSAELWNISCLNLLLTAWQITSIQICGHWVAIRLKINWIVARYGLCLLILFCKGQYFPSNDRSLGSSGPRSDRSCGTSSSWVLFHIVFIHCMSLSVYWY
jgi:hypothetical protein